MSEARVVELCVPEPPAFDPAGKRPLAHAPWPVAVLETLALAEHESEAFDQAHDYLMWRLDGRKPYHSKTIAEGYGNGYYWEVNVWIVKVDDGRFAAIIGDADEIEARAVAIFATRNEAIRAAFERTRSKVYSPRPEDLAILYGVPLCTMNDWIKGASEALLDRERDKDETLHYVSFWLSGDGRGACLPNDDEPDDPTWTRIASIFAELVTSHCAMMHEIYSAIHSRKCTTLVFASDAEPAALKEAILTGLRAPETLTEEQDELLDALVEREGASR